MPRLAAVQAFDHAGRGIETDVEMLVIIRRDQQCRRGGSLEDELLLPCGPAVVALPYLIAREAIEQIRMLLADGQPGERRRGDAAADLCEGLATISRVKDATIARHIHIMHVRGG